MNKDDIIISLLRGIETNIGNAGGGGSPSEEGGSPALVSVTYSELVTLRNESKLIPGQQYRITDYVATTTDPESRSANHPFDVIVTADSESVLNENARAIAHAGDTYFEKCDLAAWQLKYSLDNDASRWSWAQDEFEGYSVFVPQTSERVNATFESSEDTTYQGLPYRFTSNIAQYGNIIIYSPSLTGESLNVKVYISSYGIAVDMVVDISHVQTEAGKGVIFGMIDENNNNMQYDFKGIQFKRYKITDCEKAPSLVGTWAAALHSEDITIDANDFRWCYLFNVMFDDDNKDDSVGFYGGIPANCTNLTSGKLPNGVCNIDGNDDPKSCYSWICGNSCYSWTCGSSCYYWICGNNCHSWNCGDNCFGWTCDDACFGWICGDRCQAWTCGNSCYSWTCGNDCYYWICGNNCHSWNCGDICYSWTCGNSCTSWTCPASGQYFTLLAGTYSSTATLPITANVDYVQYVGKNSQGVVKVWCPADLVTT